MLPRSPARHNDSEPPQGDGPLNLIRRRPTLPGPFGPSTIGAEGLNFSVRNGKRCFPLAIATETGDGTGGVPPDPQNCTVASTPRWKKIIRQALGPLVPVC